MDFKGQYLKYEEYKALGGALSLTPFKLLEIEARNLIDLRTQNRLTNLNEIPFKVKICMFHLIEKIKGYVNAEQTAKDNNIASENIDGYSVNYITPDKIKEIIVSKNNEFDDIMVTDLFGVVVNNVAILYNGVI